MGETNFGNCDNCIHYYFDDESECYVCDMDLDQDEMRLFIIGDFKQCPYFRFGDDYTIVRKQM